MQLEGEGKRLLVGLAVIVDCSSVVVSFTFKLGSILARTAHHSGQVNRKKSTCLEAC